MKYETLVESFGRLPLITVGLPMYRAGDIGWVALESLSRQRGAPLWELVIAEEKDSLPMGKANILEYWDALQEANCTGIYYIELDHWISLAEKWLLLISFSCEISNVFVLQAADNYSFSDRLRLSADAIWKGKHHVQWNPQLLYFFKEQKAFFVNAVPGSSAGAMAYAKEGLKFLPDRKHWKHVDSWIYKTVRSSLGKLYKEKVFSRPGEISFRGLNNVSLKESDEVGKDPKYEECSYEKIMGLVPEEVFVRIKDLVCLVDSWEKRPWLRWMKPELFE